jgi:Uma2 family endonuclease
MAYDISVTAEELFWHRDDSCRLELVRGELRQAPFAHANEGLVSARIMCSLGRWVKDHHLGDALGPCGFILERSPDTVRAPDIAFVRKERTVRTDQYFDGAPDLAVEVIAVSDTYRDVIEKIRDWLCAGTSAVIVVVPEPETVTIHRVVGSRSVSNVLEVDDVVPGWKMSLTEIFEA